MDLARSIQEITEEVMLKMARFAHRETGMRDLCLAGGVALNCVGNGRILREGPFEQMWIQPAAGDAGGAVGVALSLWHRFLDKPRLSPERLARGNGRAAAVERAVPRDMTDGMNGVVSSDRASPKRRSSVSRGDGYPARASRPAALADEVAALMAEEKVIGLLQGRMEFGPRALGARSIHRRRAIAEDAIGDEPQDQVSRIVPAVRAVGASRARAPTGSTWMSTVRTCCSSPTFCRRGGCRFPRRQHALGHRAAQCPRPSFRPSRTSTTRRAIQTVRRETNPRYYDIIEAFYRRTGCPVIVNTSFNVRGRAHRLHA